MNIPVLIWSCIIALVVLVFVADALMSYIRNRKKGSHHIIELCKEREMFFVPGDPVNIDIYDYDDFDDL